MIRNKRKNIIKNIQNNKKKPEEFLKRHLSASRQTCFPLCFNFPKIEKKKENVLIDQVQFGCIKVIFFSLAGLNQRQSIEYTNRSLSKVSKLKTIEWGSDTSEDVDQFFIADGVV